ncbi:hypothetical protein MKW98_008449 [Papaver atlanticum]|uniref:Retrotransposon gag domain-containing protein n=1 Tax=Papaver atlanticum TaxID=357466 RepID=A0AAD4SK19_9MAGN|nr:hypothetical protein MKW98_008449 [Papaver atlanticum]
MSGRRGTRNTRNTGNGEAPDVVEVMRLMTQTLTTTMDNQSASLTALIQNQNGNHNAPPPPPGGDDNGNPPGGGEKAAWLNLLEKFVRLKPPQFEGSSDPLVVDKWKEDIDKIFMSMRCTPVQRQQLVVFQLSGEERKWWMNSAMGLDQNTLTCAQFCERFDARYFQVTVRHKKIKEFADLEQVKHMIVDDYLDCYISLQRFGYFMTHDEDKSARKFENGLGVHIRGQGISYCFPTFQQVVDSARATEADWLRNKETK